MSTPLLGVVADDVTGACDLADGVCDEGLSAVVVFGVPDRPLPECDCAVVALKSRTAPVAEAVAESVAAARRLLDARFPLLYQKYCSTFDSTDHGNIGPVADALCEASGATLSIGTPATPRVGRTVYQGHLFVGRQLLSDSPMRDHPLTPMRESDLVTLLARQSGQGVASVARSAVARGPAAVAAAAHAASEDGARHLLLDALDEADLDVAAAAVQRLAQDTTVLAGGAAGLAAALARVASGSSTRRSANAPPAPAGHRLIISGSCSQRTREQVAAFSGPHLELSPLDLAADPSGTVDRVVDELAAVLGAGSPVLVSSSAAPERVAEADARLGPGRAAALLEDASGAIARRAVDTLDVRRLLVAGGETSGAVVRALGLSALRVGPRVGPGLSWMVPASRDRLAVLLKSGNFGEPDLFTTAWEACP